MPQLIGKYLIIFGFVIVAVGIIFLFAGKIPWLGRLPGDILVKKENFVFYFPIMSCILASIVISLVFYLFFRK